MPIQLGLGRHLRFRFRGTAWAAEARPASPGWARLDAEKPVAMVFQDDRRPPEALRRQGGWWRWERCWEVIEMKDD